MNLVKHHLHRYINQYLLKTYREHKDILAMQVLAPLSPRSYIPWSPAAMRPGGVVAVLNDIAINHRACIVECGSGVSTIYIGLLLRKQGGCLYAIEHDERWAAHMHHTLFDEGLSDTVKVIHAPLVPTTLSLNNSPWYDPDKIRPIIEAGPRIDMLLVDGPPAYERRTRHARYPAVPFFKDHLAEDYTIVLDDINRRGEHEILNRWESLLNIKFERRYLDGCIALGRPHPSFWT